MSRGIFNPRSLSTLASFTRTHVLLGFDYDGTLAPIAATPAAARMRAVTRRLLARVARHYPCVVISGRALGDISARLALVPVRGVFGNHGLEASAVFAPAGATANARSRAACAAGPTVAWVRHLRRRLPPDPGIMIEDKRQSVTVHFRRARDRQAAIQAIESAVGELEGVRVMGGHEAVNLLPRGGANKGVALCRALQTLGCETAIFVGDDETDEDVFTSAGPETLLSISIGARRTSRARYHLGSQAEIDLLLEHLLRLRNPSP